tara:strand:+ start:606 stop:935 length:330 start_codon:yes stop_codon:yes gene_type:complete
VAHYPVSFFDFYVYNRFITILLKTMLHTVLDVQLDFTNFPEFDEKDKEHAKELCLGEYQTIDCLSCVSKITELFKFPVISAIIFDEYENTISRYYEGDCEPWIVLNEVG